VKEENWKVRKKGKRALLQLVLKLAVLKSLYFQGKKSKRKKNK